jgi:hypothetical protein
MLAAAMPASLARSQTPSGSRINTTPGAVQAESDDIVDARRVMRTFARCVARNRPRLARAILAMPYLGEEQRQRVVGALGAQDNCLGRSDVQLEFGPPSILEGMAVQMLEGPLAGGRLDTLGGLTEDQLGGHGLTPRNGYEDIALCIVRSQPALVRAFVTTEPATEAERAAFRRIVPLVPPCVSAGQNLSMDMRGLRPLLAVGLYRALDALRPAT